MHPTFGINTFIHTSLVARRTGARVQHKLKAVTWELLVATIASKSEPHLNLQYFSRGFEEKCVSVP